MTTAKKIFAGLIIGATLLACNDEFDPFGVYRENFILNCILRSDTTRQVATVTSTYNLNTFDPSTNKTDPAILGADIKVYYNKSVAVFGQNSVPRTDTSRYKTPFVYYSADNFEPLPGKTYEIEALLPNGRRLEGTTTVPNNVTFGGNNTEQIPPEDGSKTVFIEWRTAETEQYIAARFKIIYFHKEGGKEVRYEKIVPQEYVNVNGELKPHYPEPSFASKIQIDMETFDRAMAEISEGDRFKERYTILSFVLEIMIYDKNLTSYYSSTTDVTEDFSIKLDETEYSNIHGGLGVFGSYNKQRTAILFTSEYIRSFGYEPGIKDPSG